MLLSCFTDVNLGIKNRHWSWINWSGILKLPTQVKRSRKKRNPDKNVLKWIELFGRFTTDCTVYSRKLELFGRFTKVCTVYYSALKYIFIWEIVNLRDFVPHLMTSLGQSLPNGHTYLILQPALILMKSATVTHMMFQYIDLSTRPVL